MKQFSHRRYAIKHKLSSYKDYLISKYWQEKSQWYKTRFPFCEDCKKKYSMDVHHVNYLSLGKEKYWDLLALCRECHYGRHSYKQVAE